ncbi:MAG: 30S ribosomal protein S20 [Patescibacteria group bacterium]|nr:30S ribosomal protein S20 [Patescibacteria group bacterium]
MPIKKAGLKDRKQTVKRTVHNKSQKRKIHDLTKTAEKLIEKKEQEAVNKVKEAYKAIDKAAKNGIYKKNTAARKKSSLMKKLNKMGK